MFSTFMAKFANQTEAVARFTIPATSIWGQAGQAVLADDE
jgi:hypothetical protein